jgi:hypothetical protein
MHQDIIIIRALNPYFAGSGFFLSSGYRIFSSGIKNKFLIFFFKICRKIKFYSRFLGKLFWKIDIKAFKKAFLIIVFDSEIEHYFCEYLQRYFSGKQFVLYYWNTIDNTKEMELAKYRSKWDIFSFNPDDCRKYHLKYNRLFFPIPENYRIPDSVKIKQDIFFAGADKGRFDRILAITHEFDKIGLSYKIICPMKKGVNKKNIFTDPVSYEEILIEDIHSRAILDINYNDTYGMTMRELEALFFRKKLITDNNRITERDFYHEDNIFLIDYTKPDAFSDLKYFLEKPFFPVNEEVINGYYFDAWLRRFRN